MLFLNRQSYDCFRFLKTDVCRIGATFGFDFNLFVIAGTTVCVSIANFSQNDQHNFAHRVRGPDAVKYAKKLVTIGSEVVGIAWAQIAHFSIEFY